MAIVFTQVEIAAQADVIWSLLTDYGSYPSWNPLIRNVTVAASNSLAITLHPPGQMTFKFVGSIAEAFPSKAMTWQSHCLSPGFLDWSHQIEIEKAARFCTLRQTARFTGHLIKPTPNFMMRPVRNGFARMNEALRDMAEAHQRRRLDLLN